MSIHLIDCTLRDGGNLNNWNFSDQAIQKIIEGLDGCRADYIEVGYVGGSSSNKSSFQGKTSDCTINFLKQLPKTIHSKIAVMVVPSVCQLDQLMDLGTGTVSMIRLASYPHNAEDVYPYIASLKNRGFQVSMNLMAASYVDSQEAAKIAQKATLCGADVFYLADSFGSMTPTCIDEYITVIKNSSHCAVGFHGHNNLGLAFANALQAIRSGATYIDTSFCGMARGAGNLPTEQFVSALSHWGHFGTNYVVQPAIETADYVLNHVLDQPMKISTPEIICGISNIHYYFYDKIIQSVQEIPSVHPLEISRELGKLRPPKVDVSYINKAIEHIGGIWNENENTERTS
ncbi:aldolase [Paenibacillus sp. GCM10012307]|uniref:Aldolase n=1 Tax=Paenibacillus roseus TaxID=2798579 RepID=A0A934JAE0_9BACL|nr:aldolase [Paenibacillus roseus]MBJ6363215.1 aldolase [Paenibacillus roseus]